MYDVDYPMNRFDQVIPNLWIGGHIVRGEHGGGKAVEVGRNDNFDHVISLYTNEHSRVPSSVRIHTVAPIYDGRYPTDREIQIIERLADEAHLSMWGLGWNVLIRCQAGYNRSALVAARILMGLGQSASEAIAAVRKARGKDALCNLHFVQYLNVKQREKEALIAHMEKNYEKFVERADEGLKQIEETGGIRRGRPRRIVDATPIENFPGQMAIDDEALADQVWAKRGDGDV